jgi:hypothetical protein
MPAKKTTLGRADELTPANLLNALGLAFSVMSLAEIKYWRREWRKHCEALNRLSGAVSCPVPLAPSRRSTAR